MQVIFIFYTLQSDGYLFRYAVKYDGRKPSSETFLLIRIFIQVVPRYTLIRLSTETRFHL